MALIQGTLNWPPVDNEAVARLQDVAAGDSVVFNGTLATPIDPSKVSFIDNGFIRIVSITSANDLSGATFTVTGSQNGEQITENIDGPDTTTTYSTNCYSEITSITVDIDVAGVEIGTGTRGYLPLIKCNNQSVPGGINYTIHCCVSEEDNAVTYKVLTTLTKVAGVGISLDNLLDIGVFFALDDIQSDSRMYRSTNLSNYILIQIDATIDEAGSLAVSYMQI